MRFALIVALGLVFGPVTAQAQDAQTLADVRQEPVAELWRNSTENVCKLFGLNL